MQYPIKRMETINVSFFKNVASHEAVTVSVEQLVEGIRTGRWLGEVQRIRQALQEGNKKQAAEWKRRLPYISFGGVFAGGHKAVQLVKYSGLTTLDYDDIPPHELERMRELTLTQNCVVTAFITPSGNGLKVVVLTNGKRENHARTFAQITAFFDALLGYKSDPSCKDISRGHFVSADENAVYRREIVPFLVEESRTEREEQERTAEEPILTEALEYAAARKEVTIRETAREAMTASEAVTTDSLPADKDPAITFVRCSLYLHPAVEGTRNSVLFRLSCEACKRNITRGALQRAVIKAMSCSDFDEQEIRSVIKSAYSHIANNPAKTTDSKEQLRVKSQVSINPDEEGDDEENEEDGNDDGEALREKTPLLPESVFDALPTLLSVGLKYVRDKRERDMLLLAMITVTSSLLHNVTAYYARKRYWANLYCFVVAGAASNKGVLEYALTLCKYYFKEAADNNDLLENQYKKDLEAYEKCIRNTRQHPAKEGIPEPVRPEEPMYYYPLIPADISKARLLIHQRDNQGKGGLLFDLEADTLSAAGKQDYGDFFDFLRKFFQHETTSASFKVNGKPIYVYLPRLSVLLAGTPAQLCRMIRYSEDGLYSRFLFNTHRPLVHWMDVSPGEKEEEVEKHFDQLAMRFYQATRFLEACPTRVRLTSEQWKQLNQTFGHLLQESGMQEREDFQSCIKRHGLMTLRICMVFTALEKSTLRTPIEELFCTQAHFEAALAITTCCLEHSRLLITSIKSLDKEAGELKNPYKSELIFSQLPQQFTTQDFMELASQQDFSKSTATRILRT